jgi:hypothetical protein
LSAINYFYFVNKRRQSYYKEIKCSHCHFNVLTHRIPTLQLGHLEALTVTMKLLSTAFLPVLAAAASSSPSVTIDAGTVQGGKCEGGQKAVFYKAIPFAEPPVDKLRFEPPKAYKNQYPQGTLNATTSAPTCIQFSDDFTEKKLGTTALSSEDW